MGFPFTPKLTTKLSPMINYNGEDFDFPSLPGWKWTIRRVISSDSWDRQNPTYKIQLVLSKGPLNTGTVYWSPDITPDALNVVADLNKAAQDLYDIHRHGFSWQHNVPNVLKDVVLNDESVNWDA